MDKTYSLDEYKELANLMNLVFSYRSGQPTNKNFHTFASIWYAEKKIPLN
ncbi:hypothetical protein Hanom_Chr14g01307321 [Helianthus anomalus]